MLYNIYMKINKLLPDTQLNNLATKNAITKLDSKEVEPSNYSKLQAEEQLYVQFIAFAGLSMERATNEIAKRVNEKVPGSNLDPKELLIKYRFDNRIQNAIDEVIDLKDREYSVMIQNDGKLGRDVIRTIAITSDDPELRFKAAKALLDAAENDFRNKRSKNNSKVNINNTQINNTVEWKITMADEEDFIESKD